MKTTNYLIALTLLLSGSSVFAQSEPVSTTNTSTVEDSTKAKWHPYAKVKWPDGKDDKSLDSGQHMQASGYLDRRAKKWSLGVNGGASFFHGDADKKIPSWTVGPYIKYSISQTFGLRGEYNWGKLRGARDRQAPTGFKDDFNFSSKYQDYSLQMVFTLGNISFIRPLRKTQMYLFAGVGQGSFKSESEFIDQRLFIGGNYELDHYYGNGTPNPNLGQASKETYQGRHAIIPMGLGFQHNLGRHFDMGLEYKYNYTRNDDIDVYNTPIWENRWWDSYTNVRLSLEYKFGNKNEQHYDWLSPVESIYDRIQNVENKMDSLTGDIDGDHVSDYWDVDNTTPDTCMVYGNGLAVDTDRDGIPDCQDLEISDTDCEVDENGKMLDDDADGVPNCRDREPNSISNAQVDANGVEIKSSDCCDCEDINLPSVHFDSDKTNIKPEYYASLYELAQKMKQCPDVKVNVVGHADKNNSTKYNERLSANRSSAIIDYMVNQYGISRGRFSASSMGEAAAGSNDYESRKVEFKAIK